MAHLGPRPVAAYAGPSTQSLAVNLCESGHVNGDDALESNLAPISAISIIGDDVINPSPAIREEFLEDLKDELRGKIREQRKSLDPRAVHDADLGIARQASDLAASLGLSEGDTIAAYVSRRHEPGTSSTLEALRSAGIEILLPVLGPALARGWGRPRGPDDPAPRAPGRPLEPTEIAGSADEIARARLVLVPALAVDDSGLRLGQGGGWYDRALLHADLTSSVIAVVYDDEAHHAPLPRAPHDVPVAGVLTPTAWWRLDSE